MVNWTFLDMHAEVSLTVHGRQQRFALILTGENWQGKFKLSVTVWQPTGKLSLTRKAKLTGNTFPDGRNRQQSVPDGFPSGKTDFPWRLFPDGGFLTVTVRNDLSWRFLTFPWRFWPSQKKLPGVVIVGSNNGLVLCLVRGMKMKQLIWWLSSFVLVWLLPPQHSTSHVVFSISFDIR
jgi:hypothetical protein